MPLTDKPVSRREFARRGLGAAATLLPLPELLPAATEREPAAKPPVQGPAAPNLSSQGQAEAEARYQAILQQYPDRFSEAQKADLKRLCISVQPTLDRLRAYPVSNGDLPALYLKPLVDRDKNSPAGSPPALPGAANSPLAASPARTGPSKAPKP